MKLNKLCNLIFVLLTFKAVTLGALEWIPEDTIVRDPFTWAPLPAQTQESIQHISRPKKNEEIKSEPFEWHLSGISSARIPCALLRKDNQTLVVRTQEEIGQGWKIDKISATSVICKHRSGDRKELWL